MPKSIYDDLRSEQQDWFPQISHDQTSGGTPSNDNSKTDDNSDISDENKSKSDENSSKKDSPSPDKISISHTSQMDVSMNKTPSETSDKPTDLKATSNKTWSVKLKSPFKKARNAIKRLLSSDDTDSVVSNPSNHGQTNDDQSVVVNFDADQTTKANDTDSTGKSQDSRENVTESRVTRPKTRIDFRQYHNTGIKKPK